MLYWPCSLFSTSVTGIKMNKRAAYNKLQAMSKTASFIRRMRKFGASNPGAPSVMESPEMQPMSARWDSAPLPNRNGYLDITFNDTIPDDEDEYYSEAKRRFGNYLDDEKDPYPASHYDISDPNEIATLAQISRYYGGVPITFTDPYGEHPGLVQYNRPDYKRTKDHRTIPNTVSYAYGAPLESDNRLMLARMGHNNKEFMRLHDLAWQQKNVPYPTLPKWWMDRNQKFVENYQALDQRESDLMRNGKTKERIDLVTKEIPSFLNEYRSFAEPKGGYPYEVRVGTPNQQ